jgi:ADP-ribose pyrophosphatase YjhB (NUDIX family)
MRARTGARTGARTSTGTADVAAEPIASPEGFFAAVDPRQVVPHLSVDCAVFGFDGATLQVLLLRWRNVSAWSLPGGYVRWDEDLDAAAARVLRERAGVERIDLRQFHAFGARDRGQRILRPAFAAMGVDVPEGHWVLGRTVSVAYLALVPFAAVRPSPGLRVEEWRWWPARSRPPMTLDHDAIVARALDALRAQARAFQLGGTLLPEKFLLSELQRLYEAVLGQALDARNFRKKVLELGVVEPLPELLTGRPHRAARLYRFIPTSEHETP